MILNRTVVVLLILIFFILMSVTQTNAAEPKVVNIGWTELGLVGAAGPGRLKPQVVYDWTLPRRRNAEKPT